MTVIDRVIEKLKDRRQNVLNGNINCIPSPFARFRGDFVGIEQGKYYLISAAPKCCKTQLTSFLFLYNALDYAFNNSQKLRLKVFYYPLEESVEQIVLRYMSHLLYKISEGRIRVNPTDLKSTNENKILPEEIIDLLESDDYQERLKFFEEHVEFSSERNPTGMWKQINNYAETHGKIYYKDIEYVDTTTGEVVKHKKFDYYEPNDPNEYVLWYVDHLSLLTPERSMTLRETMNKCSEYGVIVRNKYNYSPVFIQQQGTETTDLEAFKNKKIRPTPSGLSDTKYTAKDCNIMIGSCNPYSFEIPSYLGYDISKLKDNVRFIEICVNRDGNCNSIIALYFDGSVSYFNELPLPNSSTEMAKVYEFIKKRDEIATKRNGISMFTYAKKHTSGYLFLQKFINKYKK